MSSSIHIKPQSGRLLIFIIKSNLSLFPLQIAPFHALLLEKGGDKMSESSDF